VSAAGDPILVAGGARDPNVAALLRALRAGGAPVAAVLVGGGADPAITWDLDADSRRTPTCVASTARRSAA
jgi:hypothetical protein